MPGPGAQSRPTPVLVVLSGSLGASAWKRPVQATIWCQGKVFLAWRFLEADPETIRVHSSLGQGVDPGNSSGRVGRGRRGRPEQGALGSQGPLWTFGAESCWELGRRFPGHLRVRPPEGRESRGASPPVPKHPFLALPGSQEVPSAGPQRPASVLGTEARPCTDLVRAEGVWACAAQSAGVCLLSTGCVVASGMGSVAASFTRGR